MTRISLSLRNEQLITDFSHWLTMLGYQPVTVYGMGKYLYYLLLYLADNGLQIEETALQNYIYYVQQRPKMRKGVGGLSANSLVSIYRMVSLLQEYFLLMKGVLLEVYLPPLQKRPSLRRPLTREQIAAIEEEVEKEKDAYLRLRDHAFLAVLYGCGLRLGEARRLEIKHLLLLEPCCMCYQGKQDKGVMCR